MERIADADRAACSRVNPNTMYPLLRALEPQGAGRRGEWEHPERRCAPLLPAHRRRATRARAPRGRARPAAGRASPPRSAAIRARAARLMGRVSAAMRVPGVATSEAEELLVRPRAAGRPSSTASRTSLSVDERLARTPGAEVVWDSSPAAAAACSSGSSSLRAPRRARRVEVEDAKLRGRQRVAFEPAPDGADGHARARLRRSSEPRGQFTARRRLPVRPPPACATSLRAHAARFARESWRSASRAD